MLKFPDNTQIAVNGLDAIMEALHAEDRKADSDTARAIIQKLIEQKNYIPSSETARREYAFVLLEEYRKFIKARSGTGRQGG